jgi:RNA polymerase sigma-54 factor
MVSLLALNKQELKEMIDTELLENPLLEQLEDSAPAAEELQADGEDKPAGEEAKPENDPFEDIDFGSYFQDYLDPGYRTPHSSEIIERPSFENFLSTPTTLADHLTWQLGSLHLTPQVREAAELIIGNLNEDGYLTASDEELLAVLAGGAPAGTRDSEAIREPANGNGHAGQPEDAENLRGFADLDAVHLATQSGESGTSNGFHGIHGLQSPTPAFCDDGSHPEGERIVFGPDGKRKFPKLSLNGGSSSSAQWKHAIFEALETVRGLDPAGVAARDLRECLLIQLDMRMDGAEHRAGIPLAASAAVLQDSDKDLEETDLAEADGSTALARRIIDEFLTHLLKRDLRELSKLTGSPQTEVQQAIDVIRGLDPKPGQRYNREEPQAIEPDVAFVKREDEYVIVMNDDELPSLRLNRGYRRMLMQDGTEREVREYVKDRYRSALQLMRNIEQRKNTILRTCETIVRRQREFLDEGMDALKPMMIKEVAEEIGVHASTVSRAVANKYVHTPQGVFELRFFFSEGVNGPEGAATPLLLLKRKVKKMIEQEDPHKPLTDDLIARMLQAEGIAVNRRTVAKYREDMGIPSTHQRRVRA